MTEASNILDRIFEIAKGKRIVLTLDEYAKAINSSRASLYRYRQGEKIPDSIIKMAEDLITEPKTDSKDKTNYDPSEISTSVVNEDYAPYLHGKIQILKESVKEKEVELRNALIEIGKLKKELEVERSKNENPSKNIGMAK